MRDVTTGLKTDLQAGHRSGTLGVYIHVPFCSQRCIYCDFYFVTKRGGRSSFVSALCREIELYGRRFTGRRVDTVYVGGGTPSLLSVDAIGRMLDALGDFFDVSQVRETTLEMNPEDLSPDYLAGLRSLGINRASVGIQSYFSEDLRFMNRSHGPTEAEAAIPMLRQAGFDNFTADLIFGLPDQRSDYWQANLERLAEYDTPHVSTYGLTIEPATPLHKMVRRGLTVPAKDEVHAQCYERATATLCDAGYEHYEISSFALPGRRALHNQRYWQHLDYLGFGPSAHSFLRVPARRWSNVRSLRRYVSMLEKDALPVDLEEVLASTDLANERVMLGLRTAEGIDLDDLTSDYGYDLAREKKDELAAMEKLGLITLHDRLRLTDRGKLVCDAVARRLILG